MAHGTRFKASSELSSAFATGAADGALRALRVDIADEQFVLGKATTFTDATTFEPKSLLSADQRSCFLALELEGGSLWLLVSFVPDSSKVRDRMLYASRCAPPGANLWPVFVDRRVPVAPSAPAGMHSSASLGARASIPAMCIAPMLTTSKRLASSKTRPMAGKRSTRASHGSLASSRRMPPSSTPCWAPGRAHLLA